MINKSLEYDYFVQTHATNPILSCKTFDNCIKIYKKKFKINKKIIFKHNKKYLLPDGKVIIASYHPSPRNVNTKVITPSMINQLFKKAKIISKL